MPLLFLRSFFALFRRPWVVWLGAKYLSFSNASRFLRFIALLSVCGIGIGVAAMVIVLSVMDGFEMKLKERMMEGDRHLLVEPLGTKGEGMLATFSSETKSELDTWMRKEQAVSLQYAGFVLEAEAIARVERRVAGVVLKGVDQDFLERFKPKLLEALPSTRQGLWIGAELAAELQLGLGDVFTLLSARESIGSALRVPRMLTVVVEGIYQTGLPEQELHTLFAPTSLVARFLKVNPEEATQYEAWFHAFEEAQPVSASLRQKAWPLRVKDWVDLNQHLFASLKLERWSMTFILGVIVLVASFNIVTTLTMLVMEQKRHIAILKAMGARDQEVGGIYLSHGLLLGLSGAFGGLCIGGLLCLILRSGNWIELPDIYYDRHIPVTFRPLYYFLPGSLAYLIVLLSTTYPALRAARLSPTKGLREG
jgi:lipoprotein-releasing system permease protein